MRVEGEIRQNNSNKLRWTFVIKFVPGGSVTLSGVTNPGPDVRIQSSELFVSFVLIIQFECRIYHHQSAHCLENNEGM